MFFAEKYIIPKVYHIAEQYIIRNIILVLYITINRTNQQIEFFTYVYALFTHSFAKGSYQFIDSFPLVYKGACCGTVLAKNAPLTHF
jgi:hypothetical protein